MEELTITERRSRSGYLSYLYNALTAEVNRAGGTAELHFGDVRCALRVRAGDLAAVRAAAGHKIAEVIGVGYKYEYMMASLNVSLSQQDKKLLCAALIAADLKGDAGYIRRRSLSGAECALDGVYLFRLAPLREKWERIASYIPRGFAAGDLKKFCDFLVGESSNKIYVKGKTVFGENLVPLRRSRLLGEEDVLTEIMLSDAGFVYCLGEVEDGVGDFLQKYYAERAIFS